MQDNEENGSGGEAGMPDPAGIDGFVESNEEEGEPDARAQDAQPIEVDIPPTYLWGVVSAQLQAPTSGLGRGTSPSPVVTSPDDRDESRAVPGKAAPRGSARLT